MSAWTDFIASQSLSPTSGEGPMLALCEHLAVVRASGEEASSYLQGQLSCDMALINTGHHRAAMHLSLKGRGLVSARVVADGEDVLLIVPAEMADAVIKALMKYRLRAKVEFQMEPQRVITGMAGLATLSDPLTSNLPDPGSCQQSQDGLLMRYPHSDHALLISQPEQALALWQRLAPLCTLGNSNAWCYQDIVAGEGQVYPGAEDLFLPQVLNYDINGGVSFKKGCYTGQEVVARMHFKGKLKQRMQRIDYHADIALAPGEILRDTDGKAVAEVVLSATGQEQHTALVVLKRDSDGALYYQEQPLQSQLAALPYPLVWKE